MGWQDDDGDFDSDDDLLDEGPQEADLEEGGDRAAATDTCPSCGAEIYDDADRCPVCGAWIILQSGGRWWLGWGVLGFLAVLVAIIVVLIWGFLPRNQ